jgi:hypothetical protein
MASHYTKRLFPVNANCFVELLAHKESSTRQYTSTACLCKPTPFFYITKSYDTSPGAATTQFHSERFHQAAAQQTGPLLLLPPSQTAQHTQWPIQVKCTAIPNKSRHDPQPVPPTTQTVSLRYTLMLSHSILGVLKDRFL